MRKNNIIFVKNMPSVKNKNVVAPLVYRYNKWYKREMANKMQKYYKGTAFTEGISTGCCSG